MDKVYLSPLSDTFPCVFVTVVYDIQMIETVILLFRKISKVSYRSYDGIYQWLIIPIQLSNKSKNLSSKKWLKIRKIITSAKKRKDKLIS